MENDRFELTATDMLAVDRRDSDYLNNKGAELYTEERYAEAVEYYRLAAAMGNIQSVSNLGYCYLYGRSMEPDIPRAIAYFRAASACGNIDASYKLGDIYSSDKWGLEDKELSVYYYRLAVESILGEDWCDPSVIKWCGELENYPSLCYALGRELSEGKNMPMDLELAYQFLLHAEAGYASALKNGANIYSKCYEGVQELLTDPRFDDIRKKFDEDSEDSETYLY